MAKMNKAAVRRMIERISRVPESYDQSAFYIEQSGTAPCGTVACLAGEAVICSTPDEKEGLRLAMRTLNYGGFSEIAQKVLGLSDLQTPEVFGCDAGGWPRPFSADFQQAASNAERAEVVVAYLKEALKRGSMLWETEAQSAEG